MRNLVLVTILFAVNLKSTLAGVTGGCIGSPPNTAFKGNGFYFGYTWDNCKSDHMYICKNLGWRYGTCDYAMGIGEWSCSCRGTYIDCYDYKGNKVSDMNHIGNPFTGRCAPLIDVIVNVNNSNCYIGAYGNNVLLTNMKKRIAKTLQNNDGTPRMINGRCMIADGWCPCQRKTAEPVVRPVDKPVVKPLEDRCGPEYGKCADKNACCSQYGYCDNKSEHCGIGCQPKYGLCYNSTSSDSIPVSNNVEGKCGPNYGKCGNKDECCISEIQTFKVLA
ncbi:carbohydrate-binding module family 18 protein [Piromyces sp. E2]|nr:carbohydrate-binding module family 18 protein [Piromyces sp. E2]|eukprot:OUM61487.1 carbohydrate-binding module family 18 protein [Piromyces sp. E2]